MSLQTDTPQQSKSVPRAGESLRLALAEFGSPGHYFVAVLSVSLAAWVTSVVQPYMPSTLMPLFFGAVMLSAWVGGFWPGIAAALLAVIALDRIIVPSRILALEELVGLALFLGISVFTSLLNGMRKHAQDVMRRQQAELELRVADRTRELVEMNQRLQEEISDRRRAQEHIRNLNVELERRVQVRTKELQRSNEALQQFAYSASHDLQEPLRMVGAYTRLLERRYKDVFDQDGREYLHFVIDGADRMTQLINDLLAFSREGGASKEEPEEVDMSEVVATAVSNLKTAIEETGATIDAPPLPRIHVRRAGLVQVLQNLLSNSIKYRSEAPPSIQIREAGTSNEWIFCVADNGVGFEQSQAETVFGVFQRLHGRNYPGTGIGLAICRRIIERNGGRMWAESSPGEGSKFYFSLPKKPVREETTEVTPPSR
jgi:signal transduction histidine kinase